MESVTNSKAQPSEPESLNMADSAGDFWICQFARNTPICLKLGDWLPCLGAEVRNPLGLPPPRRTRRGQKPDSAIRQENLHLCPTTFEARHFERHSDPITEKGNSIRSHGMPFVYIRSCNDEDASPTSHFDLFLILITFNPQLKLGNVFSRCCIACWFVRSCCLRTV